MTAACSRAASEPRAPIATATSAAARLGASLTPSPTIATRRVPSFFNSWMAASLSAGSSPARTWLMPSSAARRSAVARRSPVSMTVSTPAARRPVSIPADSGRSWSRKTRRPARPGPPTYTSATSSSVVAGGMGRVAGRRSRLPRTYSRPLNRARSPWPGIVSKPSGSWRGNFASWPSCLMARLSG